MDSKLFLRQGSLRDSRIRVPAFGLKSGFAHSESEHHGETTSTGSSEREVPLLTPQQIMQLPDWQMIGFHRNLPPFLTRVIRWFKNPELVRRTEYEAPHQPELPSTHAFKDGNTNFGRPVEKTPWHKLFPNSADREDAQDGEEALDRTSSRRERK